MSNVPTINSARLHLMKLAANCPYGRIENLHIREGDPCMNPPPQVIEALQVMPGKKPSSVSLSPKLSPVWQSFFRILDELRNTVLLKIVIQDGVPVSVEAPKHPWFGSGD